MAEPLPPEQTDNPITRKVLGLPVIVWVIIIAVLAYLWFSRQSGGIGGLFGGGSGSGSTSGGGGTASESGTTNVDKGAVQITVSQTAPDKDKQPKPPVHRKKHHHHGHPTKHPVTGKETVPNVVGRPYTLASRDIRAHHLVPERTKPYSGQTTEEQPKAGTKVKKGSHVDLSGNNAR